MKVRSGKKMLPSPTSGAMSFFNAVLSGSSAEFPAVKEWFVYPGNPLQEPDMVHPRPASLPCTVSAYLFINLCILSVGVRQNQTFIWRHQLMQVYQMGTLLVLFIFYLMMDICLIPCEVSVSKVSQSCLSVWMCRRSAQSGLVMVWYWS